MPKKTPGLTKRGKYWHCNKIIKGQRLYESTGTGDLEEAERYLNEETKKSIDRDAVTLKAVMPYIGNLSLEQVHMGTLEKFITDRRDSGITASTINRDLSVIRRVLVLSARLWRDGNGRTWLNEAPLLKMLKTNQRKPYPISWEEQERKID